MNKKVFKLSNLDKTNVLVHYVLGLIKESNSKEDFYLLLSGELGSGKTTFTQHLAQSLFISEKIKSPTFSIGSSYKMENLELSYDELLHIDAYRLDNFDELLRTRLLEKKNKPRLIVVEWPPKGIRNNLINYIEIKFSYLDEGREAIVSS